MDELEAPPPPGIQCPELFREIENLNRENTQADEELYQIVDLDIDTLQVVAITDTFNLQPETEDNPPIQYSLHILEENQENIPPPTIGEYSQDPFISEENIAETENTDPSDTETERITDLTELDVIQIEQISSLLFETEPVVERRDQLKETEHEDYLQEYEALTNDSSITKKKHHHAENNRSYMGDKFTSHGTAYQTMCIFKLKNRMEEQENLNLFVNNHSPKCETCDIRFPSLSDHTSMGSFAYRHEFDVYPDEIKFSLLLATTLVPTDEGFKPRYSDKIPMISVKASQRINPDILDKIRRTAHNVPNLFQDALATVAEVHSCGEHHLLFNSKEAVLLHHITFHHSTTIFLCVTCKTVESGYISHMEKTHNLELPTQYGTPSIREIISCLSGSSKKEELEKIYTATQLLMRNNQVYMSIYHADTTKLMDTIPNADLQKYRKVLKLCTLPPTHQQGHIPTNWSDLIQRGLNLTTSYADLGTIFRIVGRLYEKRAPTSETSVTRDRLQFEIFMQIICTKIDYLFKGADTCDNTEVFKEGEDAQTGLETSYGHPYTSDLRKLETDLDTTSYDIITVGTSLLVKSGSNINSLYRVLNLSTSSDLLLSTEGYEGLMFYPSHEETKIPIPVENSLLGLTKKIFNSQSKLPLLIEFNLGPNMKHIPENEWSNYISTHGQTFAEFFCLEIRKYKASRPDRYIIITGQMTLYSPNLSLQTLTELSDKLSEKLLAACFLTRIPYMPALGLVGFSGNYCIPLTTRPKGPVFSNTGNLSSYSIHQSMRLIHSTVEATQLLKDSSVYNAFRHHMVQNLNLILNTTN